MKKILLVVLLMVGTQSIGQVGSWTQKSDFNGAARSYSISFAIGDYGYLGAGQNSGGYRNDFWEYNPENDTWTQKADISGQGRFGAVGFAINDKGYWGLGSSGGDFYEYDPQTNDWNQTAPFPGTNKVTPTAFVVNGKGYVATGAATSVIGNETKEVWEFDPQTTQWTQKQDFPGTRRSRAMGFAINGKGYLGCGYYSTGSSPVAHDDFWEYAPETDEWIQKTDFQGSSRSNGVGFSLGDYGFMGMGYDGGDTVNDLWSYNPANDAWTQMVFFEGQGRLATTCFVVNDRAFVGTGYFVVGGGTVVPLNDFWEYENDLLSITKNELKAIVTVYPNPVADRVNVTMEKATFISASIIDTSGKLILTSISASMDVSKIASGVYVLEINTDAGLVSKRFLKK